MRAIQKLQLAMIAAVMGCDTMSPTEAGNLVRPTVAEDPRLPAIEMNGARFHAETFGDPSKPVIIFLHGGPGGDYRSLLRLAERHNGYSLTDEYFLVFWDQRGAGLSERQPKHALTIDTYIDDLDALAQRYSSGRPVFLIGLSWGGMYATEFINRQPHRVAGAVLIEPGPLDGATAERIRKDINDLDPRSEWLNDFAWSSQFLSGDDHERLDYLRAQGLRDSQPRYGQSRTDPAPTWRQGAVANRYIMENGEADGVFTFDFTTHLDAYTTPVLFLAGALSEVQGETLQRAQIQQYPHASLQVIAGAGHDVAWVKAAEVVTHVRNYLNSRKAGN